MLMISARDTSILVRLDYVTQFSLVMLPKLCERWHNKQSTSQIVNLDYGQA